MQNYRLKLFSVICCFSGQIQS